MDNRAFGDFLNRRLAASGQTQVDIARAMARHMSYGSEDEFAIAISRFQRMLNRAVKGELGYLPDADTLAALAAALPCTELDLLRAAGYMAEEGNTDELDDVAIYTAMMREADRLTDAPPSLKAHIRQTIEFARRLSEESSHM